jgi:AcrR family transcriptional regulator
VKPVTAQDQDEAVPTAKRAAIEAAVLSATEELLTEGASFADLNIEKIATRAGISRTAFYFYFRDKRELLMRLTHDITDILFAQAERWFAGEGDPEVELRGALTGIAALYKEHGVLLRAIVEVSTYDEEIATFWRELMSRFSEATERRIEAEQQDGHCDPQLPGRATGFALVWMTERTFYQQLVQQQPVPDAELDDAMVGIWMHTVYGRVPS